MKEPGTGGNGGIEVGRDVVMDGAAVINALDSFMINELSQTIHTSSMRNLTLEERKVLHNKVKQIEQTSGEQGWVTWRFIHRAIGVESIEDLKLDQKEAVSILLDLLMERATLKKQNQGAAAESAGATPQHLALTKSIEATLNAASSIEVKLEKLNSKFTKLAFLLGFGMLLLLVRSFLK